MSCIGNIIFHQQVEGPQVWLRQSSVNHKPINFNKRGENIQELCRFGDPLPRYFEDVVMALWQRADGHILWSLMPDFFSRYESEKSSR